MKQMIVSKITYGETFNVFGDTFVALDRVDGGVLAIRRDIWKNAPFDKNGRNDIRRASIRNNLSDYLIELFGNGANYESIIKTNVDLKATDDTREYRFFRYRAVLLTLEQYGKYQHIIPDARAYWWLATPYMTPGQKNGNESFVWSVCHNGYSIGNCSGICGIRPALVFAPSLLVEYGGGVEESDDTTENDIYMAYLDYVFGWFYENDEPKIGESPLSYEEWKCHTKEPWSTWATSPKFQAITRRL